MTTAFAVWNKRIAPVFDVARRVILVDATAGKDIQSPVLLTGDQPLQKAQQLSDLGADCLVCGAISRSLQAVLTARGIHVVAYVAGDVQDVIDAWRRQPFAIETYAMPGRRQSRHRRSSRCRIKTPGTPNGRGFAGPRAGGHRNGRQGRCRQGSPAPDRPATAHTGSRVCLQCGYRPGPAQDDITLPAACPRCGAILPRE